MFSSLSLVCLPLQLILADVLCLSKHCLWVTLMCKTYFDCKYPFITCCKQSHPYLPYISSLWQQIRGYFHCHIEALQYRVVFVFASYLGKHGLDRKEKISKKESTIFAKENNARTRKRRKMWAKNKDKEGLGEKSSPVLWDFLKLINSRWHWAEQVLLKDQDHDLHHHSD